MPRKVEKLVAVLATSRLITDKKIERELEWVPYIWYPVIFKDQTEVLLDFGSKVNIMSQVFAQQLGLKICKTNIRTLKIDSTTMKTYKIVISIFSVLDKDGRKSFFEESLLLADIKPNVRLEMPFLTISNIGINFQTQTLQ